MLLGILCGMGGMVVFGFGEVRVYMWVVVIGLV